MPATKTSGFLVLVLSAAVLVLVLGSSEPIDYDYEQAHDKVSEP
jgi:hypothetical protein